MRPRGVLVLLALILLATAMFGIGAVVEKASANTPSTTAQPETAGAETGGETGAEADSTASSNQEAVFGFNTESTPVVLAAAIGSLGVFGAVWFFWRRAPAVWAAGAVMAAFAVLDLLEIFHQVADGHVLLVTLAGSVALLHLAAAVAAVRVATASPPREIATQT